MKELLLVELWNDRLRGITDVVKRKDLEYKIIRPFENEHFDDAKYSGVIISGGKPCISEIENYSFLNEVIDFTKLQVENSTPILGICLGHQVLARAIGGKVKRSDPEIGFCEIYHNSTELLHNINSPLLAFQYHLETVLSLPTNITVFASSEKYLIQGFKVIDKPCWGVQFHPEISNERSREIFNDYRKPMEEKGINVDEMIAKSQTRYNSQICSKVIENFLNESVKYNLKTD